MKKPEKDLLAQRLKAITKAPPAHPVQPSVAAEPARPQRAPRQPVFRNASIVFVTGERMAVVIKDLSATGARIEFVARADLPNEVVMIDAMGRRRNVRVVWQREGVAGVEFVSA